MSSPPGDCWRGDLRSAARMLTVLPTTHPTGSYPELSRDQFTPKRDPAQARTQPMPDARAGVVPTLHFGPADPPRPVIGDAEMGLQRYAVGGERGAIRGMNHGAALKDDGAIGNA